MKDRKNSTFIYKGLGIPIKLINAPMKKIFGEWVIDVNMAALQRLVLKTLIHKPVSLTGKEIHYIRKHLEMTTAEFGKVFGVSHVAVVKWENEKTNASPPMELCIRLYMLNHLKAKDKEFRELYNDLSLSQLSKSRKKKMEPIAIDAIEDLKIAL